MWSGRNSHRDRRFAADRLRDRVATLRERYPSAKIAIVAHSHGGNVALYACRDHFCDSAVDGIVCIATPFIAAHAQRLFADVPSALATTAFIGCGLSVLFFSLTSPFTVACALLFALACILIGLREHWRISRGLHFDLHSAHGLCDYVTTKAPPSASLLVLRTEGDEAAAALTLSQVALWCIRATVDSPQWLLLRLRIRARDRGRLVTVGLAFSLLLGRVVGNAISVAMFPLAFVAHVTLLRVLGVSVLRDALRVQVTAEPTPPGYATSLRVDSENEHRFGGGFSHSDAMSNVRALSAITMWMEDLSSPEEAARREARFNRFYGFRVR